MIALNATRHMGSNSHVRGSVPRVEANSQFTGTNHKEGALLSMIGWEKEFPIKNSWSKKPMLVFLMSNH